MRTTTALALALVGSTAHVIAVVLVVGVLGLLCIAGIVLPAVWSASPARRKAALELIRLLLRSRANVVGFDEPGGRTGENRRSTAVAFSHLPGV
jgi:hypothetical protein